MNVYIELLFGIVTMTASPAFADEVKILDCVGETINTTIPHDEKSIPDSKNDIAQIFELHKDSLLVKGGVMPDYSLALCKKSDSEYVFSSNCKIKSRNDYLLNWNSILSQFEELHINRTSLAIDWSTYDPHLGHLVISNINMHCALSKSKI